MPHNRFGRVYAGFAVATVVAAVLTGCGSSSSKSSSPTTKGSSSSVSAAPTGSILQLGAISDESGACLATNSMDQANTLGAWQSYVNSHGGIVGHPVKVTVIDSKCDPADAAAAGQTLISDHVLAIIDGTSLDSAFEKAVDAAKIPVLCGVQTGNGFTCQSDANFFPSGTTVIAGLYGNTDAAKQAGADSYGIIYCSEVVACKQALPISEGFTKELGMTWITPVAASLSAISYTAQCLVMKQEHAQALFGAGPPSAKLADDCAQQGYHPIFTQGTGTWQTAYLKVPNLNNTTGETSDIPWFYQGPQTTVFQQTESTVLASTNFPYTVSTTYAAAELFAAALADAGANPTSQDVYNGLYAMHGETLGGYAPPLTFTQGKPTTVNCFFVVSIKSGAFVAPNGASPSCPPSAAGAPS
jgi:branched-chain amino acid transport system substrate-binding protein